MKRIIVIGEQCIDRFMYGSVDRVCPEAPVPVFIPKDTTSNPGMAANVLANLKAISRDYIFDDFKFELISNNDRIVKTRYIHKRTNQMIMRVDDDESLTKPFKFNKSIVKSIKSADGVIISDYNKGFLSNEDIFEIAALSNFCIIDTKRDLEGVDLSLFDFVKLNQLEAKKNFKYIHNNDDNILYTLGSKGCKFQNLSIATKSEVETIDVSGAGDTFTAAFTLIYLNVLNNPKYPDMMENVEAAINYANKCCTQVVTKKGVNTPLF